MTIVGIEHSVGCHFHPVVAAADSVAVFRRSIRCHIRRIVEGESKTLVIIVLVGCCRFTPG